MEDREPSFLEGPGGAILLAFLLFGGGMAYFNVVQPYLRPASALNVAISKCDLCSSPNDIENVGYHLVLSGYWKPSQAERFKRLVSEKKIVWSSSRKEWVSAAVLQADLKQSEWLARNRPVAASPAP